MPDGWPQAATEGIPGRPGLPSLDCRRERRTPYRCAAPTDPAAVAPSGPAFRLERLMAEVDPITIDEMYAPRHLERAHRALDRSQNPRRPGLLYALVDDLGVGPGDLVLDIGGR